MQILANIDEADVGKVKAGLIAKFSVDAWPGEEFEGRIREVRQSPNTINNVVTYAAVVDAPNPQRKLMPGMTASVQIVTSRRDDVLRVPNAALRFKPSTPIAAAPGSASSEGGESKDRAARSAREGGALTAQAGDHPHHHGDADGASGEEPKKPQGRRGRVYKLVDGKPVAATVRLGLQDSQHTEVLEGLAENETLIVGELGGGSAPGMTNLMSGPRPPGGGGRR